MLQTRGDKTVLRSLGLNGGPTGGVEGMVDVKDGKVLRIRPFHFDWKYDRDSIRTWKLEKNGKSLEPNWKSLPSPFLLAYKKRLYSPNRIFYPLKRVDWDPNGERNPQNRGKSKYVRISWDEATTIIANEIKRIHADYGNNAILVQGDGHGEGKGLNMPHGHSGTLLEVMGGFTQQVRNPDSWEGWYWGAKHVWGNGAQGNPMPAGNIVKDSTEHTELMLFWGCDPCTTPWGFSGQFASRLLHFWRDIGMKHVYICPDLNYGAAVHGDKWIPVLPNTDAALQLAIAYIWITEGSYDKDYVATHVHGFEKFSEYVLGKKDGIPKTAEWAYEKCGVNEWTIKALARAFAKKVTSIAHYFGGGLIRGPYSHEQARLEGCLLGMQGLGKPGVHHHQLTYWGLPRMEGLKSRSWWRPDLQEVLALPGMTTLSNWQESAIPRTLVRQHLLNPEKEIKVRGIGAIESPIVNQFREFTFPLPGDPGIRMIWSDTPCQPTCWNWGNGSELALRSPQLEFVLTQHPWLENECTFSDIVLPSNTHLEVDDFECCTMEGGQFCTVLAMDKAVEPLGESKSDLEVMLEIAKKLGHYDEIMQGKSIEDLREMIFEFMNLDYTWEEFKEKQYHLYQVAEDWEEDTPGFRKFYEDPEGYPLGTPSGKLEFYSDRLAENFPDDNERPPSPEWIEQSEMHDERRTSSRAADFPLILMSNHGHWRVHAQCDDITWTREAPTMKVKGPDGYMYEPIWIHTSEAEKRGIQSGDIVKVFNERGIVLGGAYVTERLSPGVAYCDHGARIDPIIVGRVDRGGAINTISGSGTISKNCCGQATTAYLVEVAKVTGQDWDEWREANPEAFSRKYDPAAGLRFDAWVVKEEK